MSDQCSRKHIWLACRRTRCTGKISITITPPCPVVPREPPKMAVCATGVVGFWTSLGVHAMEVCPWIKPLVGTVVGPFIFLYALQNLITTFVFFSYIFLVRVLCAFLLCFLNMYPFISLFAIVFCLD